MGPDLGPRLFACKKTLFQKVLLNIDIFKWMHRTFSCLPFCIKKYNGLLISDCFYCRLQQNAISTVPIPGQQSSLLTFYRLLRLVKAQESRPQWVDICIMAVCDRCLISCPHTVGGVQICSHPCIHRSVCPFVRFQESMPWGPCLHFGHNNGVLTSEIGSYGF